jgi:hypothetical protein
MDSNAWYYFLYWQVYVAAALKNGLMPDSDVQRYMGTYTIRGALKDGGSILKPAIFNTSNSSVNPRQDRESNELLHNA